MSEKTGSGQACAQALQKVHTPALKSTTGVLPGPGFRIASGQASMQRLQLVQSDLIEVSLDHGGRKSADRPVSALRKLGERA
ncbi:MAG: hypothetical protein FalmKO_17270 [Falsiruegeria mediterranea]